MGKDEVKVIDRLGKDAAQGFINVVHEVRLTAFHPQGAA